MRAGRIVAIVMGTLALILGLIMAVGSSVAAWAWAAQRDANGFFVTDAYRFQTATAAITSERMDLETGPGPGPGPGGSTGDWRIGNRSGEEIRLVVRSNDPERGIFVGIARASDVDQFLSGVAHDEVSSVDMAPFRATYTRRDGAATGTPPTDQDFWVASSSGSTTQTLDWQITSGQWAIVVMNTDGSAGVDADITAGAKLNFIGPLAVVLGIFGVLLLLAGAVALVLALSGRSSSKTAATSSELHPARQSGGFPDTPVHLTGEMDDQLSQWLWLVKWILAIPHFLILIFLWAAFLILTVIAGFAILFTGRYPRAIFEFNSGVLRWSWRVSFYTNGVFGTDRYPPFTLGDADYPATLDIAYPERLSRGLVLVKWWLLAIPHYLVIAFFTGIWTTSTTGDSKTDYVAGGSLIGILILIAVVVLLFTGQYPPSVFDLVMGLQRWVYRVIAYVALMTDRYPPFRLDQGGTEPPLAEIGVEPNSEPPGESSGQTAPS
jgi:hypothetical protein